MTEDEGKRYDRVYRRRRLTIAAGERKGSPTLSPLACGPSARSLECSLAKMLQHSRAPPTPRRTLVSNHPPFPSRLIAQRTRAHFYPQHWLRAIWVCISSSSSSCSRRALGCRRREQRGGLRGRTRARHASLRQRGGGRRGLPLGAAAARGIERQGRWARASGVQGSRFRFVNELGAPCGGLAINLLVCMYKAYYLYY